MNRQRARGGDEEEVTSRGEAELVESGGYGGGSERVSTCTLCLIRFKLQADS